MDYTQEVSIIFASMVRINQWLADKLMKADSIYSTDCSTVKQQKEGNWNTYYIKMWNKPKLWLINNTLFSVKVNQYILMKRKKKYKFTCLSLQSLDYKWHYFGNSNVTLPLLCLQTS